MQDEPSGRLPLNAIVWGATGATGREVLRQCTADPRIGRLSAVTRRPIANPIAGVVELQCSDFGDPREIGGQLAGIDVAFYCLGVSQASVPEPARYRTITHDYALAAAAALFARSPHATFHFVSGAGADPTGRARMMWARVKGETESDLLQLRRERTFVWRPAYIHAVAGREHRSATEWAGWALFPLMRWVPGLTNTTVAIARAMLHATFAPPPSSTLGPRAIDRLARAYASSPTR